MTPTSGDGSFTVSIQKKRNIISLSFSISQHIRDKELLQSVANYLKCGQAYVSHTRESGSFFVLGDIV